MERPPVKRVLYWCDRCNVPLLGRTCACGAEGRAIPLLEPYDIRPALARDMQLLKELMEEQFGAAPIPKVILLNKAGGIDRTDLAIAHGRRMGWLLFDLTERRYRFDLEPDAVPLLAGTATRGVVVLERDALDARLLRAGHLAGKKLRIRAEPGGGDGVVIVRYGDRWGTGVRKGGELRIRELHPMRREERPDPDWDAVVERNRYHLKNLERNAVRAIRQHMHLKPLVNVSCSGGKDSLAVLLLARKAGVREAFFIDTGVELPETLEFVRSLGVEIVPKGGDFWSAAERAGPPAKDRRWCCKLLKLHPLRKYLEKKGPVLTIQGNRWYESWNRADLALLSQNPANPLQTNLSPIRNWRALEVYLYLRWQGAEYNPLYDRGIERIGCYVCPAVLESEYGEIRNMHPELAARWDDFLERWRRSHGYPPEYVRWGLWRWRRLPRKMQQLCASRGVMMPGVEEKAVVERAEGRMEKGIGMKDLRTDFPILEEVVYLDSAATSLSPEPVLEAMREYEHRYRANVGRGVHRLSRIATQRYWDAHRRVASFIGAREGEVVFVKNSTEAINMVASGLEWERGDRVVTTVMEHHSNLLPWLRLQKKGVEVEIVGTKPDLALDMRAMEQAVDERTRLVAVTHASNVTGVVNPVREIGRICSDHGALLLVDGAQSVPHMEMDVSSLGCDFLAFSGHKMLGPTGTGVLWMKRPILEPLLVGGGAVQDVIGKEYVLHSDYQRYEAGTPNIAGAIGLAAAIGYLEKAGMERIRRQEEALTERLISGLEGIPGVSVFASRARGDRIGVVSFNVEGLEPHEVAQTLDEEGNVMVRSGQHCCIPLMRQLGLENGTVRASLYLYSTEEDVDTLLEIVGALAGGG